MSLKAIEMQIALPRIQDASKIQEQIQQRGQLQNDAAASSVKREVEHKRRSVVKQEQKGQVRLREKEDKQNKDEQSKRDRKKESQQIKEVHPYKGNFFDFSG